MTEDSLIHKGHRQRMREKLVLHGSKVMQSYELLEMLLFYVIPYKNTNPTAKRLMLRFGSLDRVLSASKEELCEVEGVGPAVAEFIKRAGDIMIDRTSSADQAPYDDYVKIGELLVDRLSAEKQPKTVMLIFDNRMRLLEYKVICEQDYASGAVKPETFIDFAIKSRASVVVTAHNHPHGPLFPTVGDMASNSAVSSALNLAGITHAEHYIVSGNKYIGISKRFSLSLIQSPELEKFYKSREDSIGV